jgi:hypothetical protein
LHAGLHLANLPNLTLSPDFLLYMPAKCFACLQAPLLAYHTTMAPRYNVTTGLMDRAYLGRRFFITQVGGTWLIYHSSPEGPLFECCIGNSQHVA